MNRGSKIGLFGGSFNPPHIGHLLVSRSAIKKFNLKKLLWLVVPQNPFKGKNNLLPLETRFRLCVNMIKNEKKTLISDLEKKLPSYQTYFTIQKIKRLFPFSKLFWIMGLDNFYHFLTWKRADYIMKNVNIIAFPRGNFHKAVRTKFFLKYKTKIHILKAKKIHISSTEIRNQNLDRWQSFCSQKDYTQNIEKLLSNSNHLSKT
jgi:nicotinate (nicotinamide) nucleotide adenylyltransferase